jgi:recombination protein RecR
MYPPPIQKLIEAFSKFPGIGPRTAARFVFYLIRKKERIDKLILAISGLKKIKFCKFCFEPFQPAKPGNVEFCQICSNQNRDRTLLCVVEKEQDLVAIEKTKKYRGLYFVLGGLISKLKKEEIEKLRIKDLILRIKNPEKFGIKTNFKEIILALNPTTEGEATALYLERKLKNLGKKITRLGRGLPVGAELEYADEETLGSALEGRK